MEQWKPIPECEGRYEVSNHGRVRNSATMKVLAPRKLPTGYQRVHLRTITGRRDLYIHRLVADAFCSHPEGCEVINHIDNNPRNNNADNLEWVTPRDNTLYAMKQGRVPRFPNAKAVVATKDGERIVFRSTHEASQMLGCDHKGIVKCCKNIKFTCKGFHWEYMEVAI